MGIADYNLKGEQKNNIAYFASIVKLALADGIISEGEEKLLKRLAKQFHIMKEMQTEIIKNPSKFSMVTPHSYDERIEQLFLLAKMIYADDEVSKKEASTLRKIAVGLGFPIDNIEKVVDEAIHLILNDNDLEDFTKSIKQVNKI
ncbi:TerB family tellurite resistance protein [Lutibacter sp.]|uniref:TerB family tellurite resistance protein n=1 Tax=Lutibacter sp. TaxID=1925666 RepID=UPI0025BA5369|nr:TerB family tellurite resistance protein [Lutibacter sp.]MCF6182517.1 TerB family tellurite resistance protein [Lutibacter sp.]